MWVDPLLPELDTPTQQVLNENPIRFGSASFVLTQNQWEMFVAEEEFVGWLGGVRSAKTYGGIFRGMKLSFCIPDNKGIVGRFKKTDLEDTTQRDWNALAQETGLVKSSNDRKTVVYCIDPDTGDPLPSRQTSEVLFLYLDNPNHFKGHGVGWFHMDEAHESEAKSFYRLTDRLSHPAAQGRYTGFCTSNPEGRDWFWNHFYNPDTVMKRPKKDRLKYRAIHNRTQDNPFLPPDYIANLYAVYPHEWVERYINGSVDVFEGQVHTNWDYGVHVVPQEVFHQGQPPAAWNRLMGLDVGGSNNWGVEFAAVDPEGNVIIYDEINEPGTDTDKIVDQMLPKMKDLKYVAKVIDYENKPVWGLLKKRGIAMTNARKQGKMDSILILSGYLQPNPKHSFPKWHPRAGEKNSPHLFITSQCKGLISEIPQQRWHEQRGTNIVLNEIDPKVRKDAYDALRYILRELPRPTELKASDFAGLDVSKLSLMSRLYHVDARAKREEKRRSMLNDALMGRMTGRKPKTRFMPTEYVN